MSQKKKKSPEIRNCMRPGDVIAFGGSGFFSTLIKGATDSRSVSPVGIVVQSKYRRLATNDEDNESQREVINTIMESTK